MFGEPGQIGLWYLVLKFAHVIRRPSSCPRTEIGVSLAMVDSPCFLFMCSVIDRREQLSQRIFDIDVLVLASSVFGGKDSAAMNYCEIPKWKLVMPLCVFSILII